MTIDTAKIAQRTIWTKAELDEALNILAGSEVEWLFGNLLGLATLAGGSPARLAQWAIDTWAIEPLTRTATIDQEAP